MNWGFGKSRFAKVNLSNKRAHAESREAYHGRLKNNNKAVNDYLSKGTPVWTSCIVEQVSPGVITKHRVQGTYRRANK
jgi:hypothetical protein